MEALWKLEDKLKLSTGGAFVALAITASAATGLCVATLAMRKMARQKRHIDVNPEPSKEDSELSEAALSDVNMQRPKQRAECGFLMRWSSASKWGCGTRSWRERMPHLLLMINGGCGGAGWKTHETKLPVWQRPILMGEKCELPRFSGLILYDERGQPLLSDRDAAHKEKPVLVRTALQDLL